MKKTLSLYAVSKSAFLLLLFLLLSHGVVWGQLASLSFAVREGWSINASLSGYSPIQPRPNYLRYDQVRDTECRISLVVNYTDQNGTAQTARHFVTLRPINNTETNYFLTVNPNDWRQPIEMHVANSMQIPNINLNNNTYNPNNNNNNSNNNNYNPNGQQNMSDCRASVRNGYFSTESWAALLRTLRETNSDNTRSGTAKSALKRANVTAAQVLELIKLFSFESTKLDLAKYAFDYTCDPQNYFIVNQGFQFESSKSDLNEFLDGK